MVRNDVINEVVRYDEGGGEIGVQGPAGITHSSVVHEGEQLVLVRVEQALGGVHQISESIVDVRRKYFAPSSD